MSRRKAAEVAVLLAIILVAMYLIVVSPLLIRFGVTHDPCRTVPAEPADCGPYNQRDLP